MHQRIAIALVVVTLMAAAAGPAAAKTCKSNFVSAYGSWHLTYAAARLSARLAWKSRARAVYGSRWDTWARAADSQYSCVSIRGREHCLATARPCR